MKPKIKEVLFDSFTIICVPIGFAIHSWSSLCFLLVGSICGAFALYHTLLNHRVHEVTESQARYWGLLFFAVFSIGVGLYWRECKQPGNPALVTVIVPQPDYIEGTHYTEDDLKNLFPFGSVVIWFSENTIERHQYFKTGLAEWDVDWQKVKIMPNVAAGTVAWEIGGISVTNIKTGLSGKNLNMFGVSPFQNGAYLTGGIQLNKNDPSVYAITLNANQRSPVFAVGFRISTPEETNGTIHIP